MENKKPEFLEGYRGAIIYLICTLITFFFLYKVDYSNLASVSAIQPVLWWYLAAAGIWQGKNYMKYREDKKDVPSNS